jgi:hypothetical protein
VATATAAIVVLTPANFYHFQRPKFNFQPLSFTFETFGKNLHEQKWLLGSMGTPKKPCLNSWQGSAQLSPPLPEFCTDEDNSVIRSAMDALRY